MSSAPTGRKPAVARFGVFEIDLEARELRKQGRKLRLQEQPFAVLTALIEQPGSTLSREDLRSRLWPSDTFVDFDHSLNTAVNKLREVLGDSASSPRFIETVARRGYRFLADVQWQVQAQDGTQSPQPAGKVSDLPQAHRGATRSLFALIQLMYLCFYVAALARWQGIERVPWVQAHALVIVCAVLVSAAIGIPVRLYLFSAVAFDYSKLGSNFLRIFIAVFLLDELWAIGPFLIFEQIGFGAALAATAALLYVPFAERTLIRMTYDFPPDKPSVTL